MAQTKRRRKIVVIIGLLAVIAIVIIAALLLRSQAKANAIFIIDGKAYGEKEVKDITSFAVKGGEPQDKAAKEAFGYLKRQHVAEEMGIKISDQAIDKQVGKLFGNDNKAAKESQWAQLVAYDNALIERLDKLAENANISGYVYVFFFGQQIERGPAYTPPHYGDKAIIARDKAYAKKEAENYHKALKTGALTPKEAFKKLEADERLGWFNKPNSNPSGRFEGNNLLDYPNAILLVSTEDYINSNDIQKGLSAVRLGSTPVNTTIKMSKAAKTRPTYYYFTLVQKLDRSQSRNKFDSNLKNLSARYIGFKKESKK